MCHFITLVTDAPDTSALDAAMRGHDRFARPTQNESVAGAMRAGERQFHTNPRECDCGTVLGRDDADATDEDNGRAADRLRRKGWSEARIRRSLEESARVRALPAKSRGADSLSLWQGVVSRVLGLPGVSTVGVLVHDYSGPSGETFTAIRRDWPADATILDGLTSLREDELLMFRLSSVAAR